MSFDYAAYADEAEYATYSPEDDKVRIYSGRMPRELYDQLKAARFNRAYKQGCFYAKWYPNTEDIALALCGEITDEDSSLFDRAEARHSRFATYSSNAEKRAEQAIAAGDAAVGGIPMGQPILVGHHSEKRHRRDIEKARRAAEKTVEEVDRRDYWKWRAKGVLRHANRTFDRGVIMRRIKKLEAALRKKQRELNGKDYDDALGHFLYDWARDNPEEFEVEGVARWRVAALSAAMWSKGKSLPDGQPKTQARLEKWQSGRERYCNRWIGHLEGLIGYWKTILGEEHGEDIDEQYPLKKGCWIHCKYGWAQVVRVNKGADKRISSVSVDKETASWYRGDGWFYPRKVEYPGIKEWSETDPSAEEVHQAQLDRIGPPRKEPEPDPLREQAEANAEKLNGVEVKVNYNPDYFYTPHDVVTQMLNEVDFCIGSPRLVLEPNAGDGRIVIAAMDRWKGMCYWCEINVTAQNVLKDKGLGHLCVGDDFLEVEPDPKYDAVVMNPPFSKNQYRKHVQHAYKFVKPGGVLVAIVPKGAYWGNSKDKFFRWIQDMEYQYHIELPRGTFEDTKVPTCIVVIRKPA